MSNGQPSVSTAAWAALVGNRASGDSRPFEMPTRRTMPPLAPGHRPIIIAPPQPPQPQAPQPIIIVPPRAPQPQVAPSLVIEGKRSRKQKKFDDYIASEEEFDKMSDKPDDSGMGEAKAANTGGGTGARKRGRPRKDSVAQPVVNSVTSKVDLKKNDGGLADEKKADGWDTVGVEAMDLKGDEGGQMGDGAMASVEEGPLDLSLKVASGSGVIPVDPDYEEDDDDEDDDDDDDEDAPKKKKNKKMKMKKSNKKDCGGQIVGSAETLILELRCSVAGCNAIMVGRPGEKGSPRKGLNDHLANCHGLPPYNCLAMGCKAQFKEMGALGPHVRDNHGDVTVWPCPQCDSAGRRTFPTHRGLRHHLWYYHLEGLFGCPACDYQASRPIELKKHRYQFHSPTFACPVQGCGRQFKQRSNLERHQRTHSGLKPYSCVYDKAACQYSSEVRCHVVRHIREKHLQLSEDSTEYLVFNSAPVRLEELPETYMMTLPK